MATVAVDFDGVIHAYDKGWQDGSIYGEPVPGAFDGLTLLMQRYAVFIHTSRDPGQVGRWMKKHSDIPVAWFEDDRNPPQFWNHQDSILITSRKLPAVAYIDDRAIRFESWDQALADLEPGAVTAPRTGLDGVADAIRAARGGDPPAQIREFA